MKGPLFFIFAFLVMALQTFLCVKYQKTLIRLIPAFADALLTAVCFVTYAVGSNWAWLIIGMLVAMQIVPIFLGWLIGLIVRKIF